jgi:hypothetical protein
LHFFIKNQNQFFLFIFLQFLYGLLITISCLNSRWYKVFPTSFRWRTLCMSPSMTKFHGFFCNVRQIFCSFHIFLIKKYFFVIYSVFDKTRQEKKPKNINRTLVWRLAWKSRIAKKWNVRHFVLSQIQNFSNGENPVNFFWKNVFEQIFKFLNY